MEQTKKDIHQLKDKYPGKLPIFVTKSPSSKDIPNLPNHKFLAEPSLSVGQFIYIIRKQLKLPPEIALFIFVNNTKTISFINSLREIMTEC